MALVARPLSDMSDLRQNMAGLRAIIANGKRKAPAPPLPTSTQFVDLTLEDDDQPAPKRHKSHPLEDKLTSVSVRDTASSRGSTTNLPFKQSLPRDQPALSQQRNLQPQLNGVSIPQSSINVTAAKPEHASQQAKPGFTRTGKSNPSQPFNPIQYAARSSSSNGIPKPINTLYSPSPSKWERKVNADGQVFYINHKTKTSQWKRPSSPLTVDQSSQKTENSRKTFATTTNSESEDVLQDFRLPQTTPIKFAVDASSPPTGTAKKSTQILHKSGHQKQPSYDQSDRDKVKAIFSSSSRPSSASTTKDDRPQIYKAPGGQRQSQREISVPERLVTQRQAVKAVSLLSRTNTPSREAQRKDQTPLRSQISVVIPLNEHKSKLPVINHEENQAKKQSLFRDIKKSVAIVKERAESVERYFGTTGFSAIYGTASDEDRQKRIHKLQPKVKKVNRRNVKLDWGDDIPATTMPFKHDELIHPREQIKEITKSTVMSITSGPPITFVNDLDEDRLNGKFQFISEYVIREGVKRQQAHSNVHVNCSSTCRRICSPSACVCMRNENMEIINKAPVPTYRARADGLIVLTDTFITMTRTEIAKSEIVECNNNCYCDDGCFNRVVQRGRTLPLEIFKTQFCGFGLRCPRDIVRGQFIDVYLGELITEAMLDKRESAQTDGEPSYLFTLDWFNEKVNNVFYHIDGEHFGSPMRFINHSCNANCAVFPVMLNEYDQNIYGLAVFALKDIPAMTDLTLDYAPQLEDSADPADFAKCQCGEKNCRGYLWPKVRATRKKRRRKAI